MGCKKNSVAVQCVSVLMGSVVVYLRLAPQKGSSHNAAQTCSLFTPGDLAIDLSLDVV